MSGSEAGWTLRDIIPSDSAKCPSGARVSPFRSFRFTPGLISKAPRFSALPGQAIISAKAYTRFWTCVIKSQKFFQKIGAAGDSPPTPPFFRPLPLHSLSASSQENQDMSQQMYRKPPYTPLHDRPPVFPLPPHLASRSALASTPSRHRSDPHNSPPSFPIPLPSRC